MAATTPTLDGVTATLEAPADAAGPATHPVEPTPSPRGRVPAALATLARPAPLRRLAADALIVAVVAGVHAVLGARLPAGKNFDEAYYPIEAQEMLRYGYEDNRGYMFIVHPPLGKWLIALESCTTVVASGSPTRSAGGWHLRSPASPA